MARIIVAGAGMAGLGLALFAGRAGHEVTLVERDDTPLPDSAPEAFGWDRRGAPQVRHSHAFLARLRNLLRDRHPDVLQHLFDAGATEMDFIEMLPEGMDRTRVAGDEDLVAIACRRTTFEWVLRRAVLAEAGVELIHGVAVGALLGGANAVEGVPAVVGVALSGGREVRGDLCVLAGGRRMDVPALLAPLGVAVPEEVEDTGIIYLSRFFRLLDGRDYPPQFGPIGGDLGYLKYGVFPGDDRTFSVTLAVDTDDTELRRRLLDGGSFIAAAAELPATALHVDGRAEPITGVEVMAGLINRRRTFVDDGGRPLVAGLHALGDAHTATNPIYGRGCSLGIVQAAALVDCLAEHGDDHLARATAYEAATATEILPWYRAAVTQDRMNREARATASGAGAGAGAAEGPPDGTAPSSRGATGPTQAEFLRSLLRDGLFPAMRVDPVVIRAFLRMFNLLEAPDSLMGNAEVIGRVMAVYQGRDERPPEAPLGPDRAALLGALA